eukprot:TRINITY_DN5079_c0_g1_i6.p1 TRINITY_DN5079_c0_g1~~TRINITY_DN5079_c0_g1_i6.p1  ORF type:complete len:327 (-),score=-22.18 TRINITY_DN5079_c0_g1_i6:24-1004(-)
MIINRNFKITLVQLKCNYQLNLHYKLSFKRSYLLKKITKTQVCSQKAELLPYQYDSQLPCQVSNSLISIRGENFVHIPGYFFIYIYIWISQYDLFRCKLQQLFAVHNYDVSNKYILQYIKEHFGEKQNVKDLYLTLQILQLLTKGTWLIFLKIGLQCTCALTLLSISFQTCFVLYFVMKFFQKQHLTEFLQLSSRHLKYFRKFLEDVHIILNAVACCFENKKKQNSLELLFASLCCLKKIQFKKQNDSKRRLCQNSSVDLVEVLKTYFNFLNYSSNIFYQILLEKDNVEKDLFQKIVFCNDRQINYICNIGGSRSKGRAETFFLGV